MQLLEARQFALSVHTACAVTVTRQPFDATPFEKSIGLQLIAFGTRKEYAGGQLILIKLRPEVNGGVVLGVQSNFASGADVTVKVVLDNAVTHTGMLAITKRFAPGDYEVMHHIMPLNTGKWSWKYQLYWKV